MTSLAGSEEENELFYFESDHLAVKGNKDYSELVKTLFLLQAQQQRAVKVINAYSLHYLSFWLKQIK